MELAYNNREPSLFAIAKLLETALVNLPRIDIVWKSLSSHLLDVCRHPHLKMREWGADALTRLVVAVVSVNDADVSDQVPAPSKKDKFPYLAPLQSLSDINHLDLRQKQLEVCLQMIQSSGETLGDGWPQIIDMVGAVSEHHTENLIRLAFQCLQVIVSDYLHNTPAVFLTLVIDAAARFGSQTQELNVSLTAIGSIWNIADYLFQNQTKVREELTGDEGSPRKGPESELHASECLWMSLFNRLAQLCTDVRPSVRKSASQTLFAALSSHGDFLQPVAWQSILWTVLFPLLDRVNNMTTEASTEKIVDVPKSMGMTGLGVTGSGSSILLHHSRNTAYKQWAETQVLALSGVSHLFSVKKEFFSASLPEFRRAWSLVLRHIELAALSRNSEVAHSALKCFQEILSDPEVGNKSEPSGVPEDIWLDSWSCWCTIGQEVTRPPTDAEKQFISQTPADPSLMLIASQSFLTTFVQIFTFIHPHIETNFSIDQFEQLSHILQRVVVVPVDSTTQAFLVTVTANLMEQLNSDLGGGNQVAIPLTQLQDAVLAAVELFFKEYLPSSRGNRISDHSRTLICPLFNLLTSLFSYASHHPSYPSFDPLSNGNGSNTSVRHLIPSDSITTAVCVSSRRLYG